ncbi:hypothetical protein K1T71_011021 [Dendrolimus kikuchii]|uniref:Uncharacterized protein n=1 Tax=Dendrolimus kikuchii TaxID=765133 RepID=A0ACC1CRH5_9NEOP|nr:hypothetical protein K1T71_011021 [Dendrolimus kikuchii]
MLCVWWDWKGIIHYELLPPGRTIDSELYCEQLTRLKQKVERKRPELINRRGVVFHHDNARPHTSLATQQKLREFGFEVLMHPPYRSACAVRALYLYLNIVLSSAMCVVFFFSVPGLLIFRLFVCLGLFVSVRVMQCSGATNALPPSEATHKIINHIYDCVFLYIAHLVEHRRNYHFCIFSEEHVSGCEGRETSRPRSSVTPPPDQDAGSCLLSSTPQPCLEGTPADGSSRARRSMCHRRNR